MPVAWRAPSACRRAFQTSHLAEGLTPTILDQTDLSVSLAGAMAKDGPDIVVAQALASLGAPEEGPVVRVAQARERREEREADGVEDRGLPGSSRTGNDEIPAPASGPCSKWIEKCPARLARFSAGNGEKPHWGSLSIASWTSADE